MKKANSSASKNTLCQRCSHDCKQPEHVKLIKCPRFETAPQQLEIPLFRKSRSKSKSY